MPFSSKSTFLAIFCSSLLLLIIILGSCGVSSHDSVTVRAQSPSINSTQSELNRVNFCQSGLPPGTFWGVFVFDNRTGQTLMNVSTSWCVSFYLPNGTYYYRALSVPGYQFPYGTGQGPFGVWGSWGVPGGNPPWFFLSIDYVKPDTSAEIFWATIAVVSVAIFGLLIFLAYWGFKGL